jgi:hypothetical protein
MTRTLLSGCSSEINMMVREAIARSLIRDQRQAELNARVLVQPPVGFAPDNSLVWC